MDFSLPGSSVHGILQAKRLPFPTPGDHPHPGIEPGSPSLQADSLPTELLGKPQNQNKIYLMEKLIGLTAKRNITIRKY